MKRSAFALSLLCLTMVSCTGNDDETSNESGVLLKKTIEVDEDGETLTSLYTYNGNKIVSADFEGDKILFTYAGNNISKMEFLDGEGVVEQIDSFTYDANGRVATFVSIEPNDDYGRKEVYVYDSDGTVAVTYYGGDDISQTTLYGTGRVFYGANNEISKIEEYHDGLTDIHNYTYDSKNSPFKNILGFDKLTFINSEADGALHNLLTENLATNNFNENITYEYTYNSSDYPKTSIEDSDGFIITTQYFY